MSVVRNEFRGVVVGGGSVEVGSVTRLELQEPRVVAVLDYFARSPLWADRGCSEVVARYLSYVCGHSQFGLGGDCQSELVESDVERVVRGVSAAVAGAVGGSRSDSGGECVIGDEGVAECPGRVVGTGKESVYGGAQCGGDASVEWSGSGQSVRDRLERGVSVKLVVGGDGGGVLPGVSAVSERTLANRKKRQGKKARKIRRQQEGVPEWRRGARSNGIGCTDLDEELRVSSKEKWKAQNELARLEAERKIQVLKASDVGAEVERRRTQVLRHTECNMVAVERAHASLSAAGSSTPELDSRVHTVVSSASISPGSSASQFDIRKLKKDYEDLVKEHEELKAVAKARGVDFQRIKDMEKDCWTVDETTREITMPNIDRLLKIYPDGWGEPGDVFQGVDGKYRKRVVGFPPLDYD